MKKTIVNIVVTAVMIATIAIGVGYATNEVEADKDRRIQKMNERLEYIVSIPDFFAYARETCGDYEIEAKSMLLPFDYCLYWYEVNCNKVGRESKTEMSYFGNWYGEEYDKFNESWDMTLLEISYTTDGWA